MFRPRNLHKNIHHFRYRRITRRPSNSNQIIEKPRGVGNAIVPYYGQEAGSKLASLLKEHIMIAVELVEAAKTGNKEKLASADKRWKENANQIAAFLASANPYWPQKDVTDLLSLHLKLTTEEAVARLSADWETDIKKFDEIHTEIMVLADALAEGIVKQYPDKFNA